MLYYSPEFYKTLQEEAQRSAREIVPLVLPLIQPQRVIDVGCGLGTWLSVLKEHGIDDVWGIDGEWVNKTMLEIPEDRFLALDLEKPFALDDQFDLVICLEVAEHLSQESADIFIESLTKLGSVILFSAAIPFQGGDNHLNEQWPEYWVRYFSDRDYLVVDCIRKKIWYSENVDWWYSQNILIFVKADHLRDYPLLIKEFDGNNYASQLSIVHPKKYGSSGLAGVDKLVIPHQVEQKSSSHFSGESRTNLLAHVGLEVRDTTASLLLHHDLSSV